MRSLTEKFNELRGLLKHGVGSIRPTGFDPVYYLLFPPAQIIEVKQRVPEWEAQLRVDGFNPHSLSLTRVINDYFRAHDLREPVLGAWRYVRSAPPSIHALETASMSSSRPPPSIAVATAAVATRTSNT